MAKIIRKSVYHPNKKKVFALGDLSLWLDTREGPRGNHGAVLELKRLQPGAQSKWNHFWSGIVRIEATAATVEPITKSK